MFGRPALRPASVGGPRDAAERTAPELRDAAERTAPVVPDRLVVAAQHAWPWAVAVYGTSWAVYVDHVDYWRPWFRTAAGNHRELLVAIILCVAPAAFLAFAPRTIAVAATAVLGAISWAGTGNTTFVIVAAFLLTLWHVPGRWPTLIALAALHPFRLVPDPVGYAQSTGPTADWIVPLVAIGLPAVVGLWLAETRRLSAARTASHEARVAASRAELEAERSADRLQMSRDMHDIIGRSVARMVLQATAIAATTDDAKARTRAERIADIGATATEDLRVIVLALRGNAPPRRPAEDWRQSVQLSRELGHTITLTGERVLDGLGPPVLPLVDAVIAEALHNVAKHAPGAAVTIEVSQRASHLRVSVTNGAAREPLDAVPQQRALGLGMGTTLLGELVAEHDGTLTSAASGSGWHVQMEVPHDPNRDRRR